METEDGWQGIPLFGYIRYLDHSGLISARFSEYARPYLLQLERQFTSWRMEQTIPLSTGYAIRHYMLGKMIQRKERRNSQTFAIDDYRFRLKLEEKYSQFSDLKRRVIDPAIEEVNEQTDVSMSVTVERVGRTPTGLTFTVDRLPPASSPVLQISSQEPEVTPYDRWLGSLRPKEYQETMQKAERIALANGYTKDGSWTWKSGIQTALRKIYREA
jgi:plasmid replication initiation protein